MNFGKKLILILLLCCGFIGFHLFLSLFFNKFNKIVVSNEFFGDELGGNTTCYVDYFDNDSGIGHFTSPVTVNDQLAQAGAAFMQDLMSQEIITPEVMQAIYFKHLGVLIPLDKIVEMFPQLFND